MTEPKNKKPAATAPTATPPTPDVPEASGAPVVDTVDVTDETLLATRGKALTFLAGVGATQGVRLALAARGYSEAVHQEGWSALHDASGYQIVSPVGVPQPLGDAKRAEREVDAWDDMNFPIADVALKHRHPAQHGFVFAGGLSAGEGAESLVRVEMFLDRLDVLQSDPERKPTRAADHAALKTLTLRGIGPEERARLRGLVQSAKGFAPVSPAVAAKDGEDRARTLNARASALRTLRAWYEEWSVVARQVIGRKDWLILLGLATRKKPAKAAKVPK